VFDVTPGGLRLIEVAPGIDIERDVFAHMAFRPSVSDKLATMDARLFDPAPMGLAEDLKNAPSGARKPRRLLHH
jgi:propionate CoA-transferase